MGSSSFRSSNVFRTASHDSRSNTKSPLLAFTSPSGIRRMSTSGGATSTASQGIVRALIIVVFLRRLSRRRCDLSLRQFRKRTQRHAKQVRDLLADRVYQVQVARAHGTLD